MSVPSNAVKNIFTGLKALHVFVCVCFAQHDNLSLDRYFRIE